MSFLVFDLGQVLLPIDPEASLRAFAALGHYRVPFPPLTEPPFLDLETDAIDPATFRSFLRKSLGKAANNHTLDDAWNALLLPFHEPALSGVKKLKQRGHKIYLLSNTNRIHVKAIQKQCGPFAWSAFLRLFDQVFWSHEVGLRKPDPALFSLVQKAIHPPPGESLWFFDDNPDNVAAAKSLGWNALSFTYLDWQSSTKTPLALFG